VPRHSCSLNPAREKKQVTSSLRSVPLRLSTPAEEAMGIDGYLGGIPVSIKPTTYASKKMLPESLGAEVVYYEKTKQGVRVSIAE
jgi:hypothetical protein